MSSTETSTIPGGPILFAYDGSELAQFAIEQASQQLAPGRDALVVCVWQPADVGFVPTGDSNLNAAQATEVKAAAEETAKHGASLAQQAGFKAQSIAVEAAPTWKGIVKVAEDRDASLIVLGSHQRTGIIGHLLGSVTNAVVTHCGAFSVLVVHKRA